MANDGLHIDVEEMTDENIQKYVDMYKEYSSRLTERLQRSIDQGATTEDFKHVVLDFMRSQIRTHLQHAVSVDCEDGKLRVTMPVCFLAPPLVCDLEFESE